jgi:hypothetical protein
MSISAIVGYATATSNYSSRAVSGSGAQQSSAAQSNASRTIDTESATILSLNRNLSTQPDNTQTDLLGQGLAKAIEAATTVDPLTGQRELLASAGKTLADTVTKLLTQNGFSADDAQAATAELTKELAKGGQALLSLNQDSSVTDSESVALANNSGSATGTQILSSSFSARFKISVDLGTGQVSVGSQTQSATSQSVTTAQTGSAAGASLQSFLDGDQGALVGESQFNLSVSTDSSVTAPSDSSSQHETPLQSLLDGDQSGAVAPQFNLSASTAPGVTTPSDSSARNPNPLQKLIQSLLIPTVSNQGTASGNIRHLAQIAQNAKTGAAPAAAAPGIIIQTNGPGGTASTSVNVSTPTALRQTDPQGYGSTLYRRSDGEFGAFTLKPTRLTA